jgi:hypothetical protein
MRKMWAIRIEEPGGPDVLTGASVPVPVPLEAATTLGKIVLEVG